MRGGRHSRRACVSCHRRRLLRRSHGGCRERATLSGSSATLHLHHAVVLLQEGLALAGPVELRQAQRRLVVEVEAPDVLVVNADGLEGFQLVVPCGDMRRLVPFAVLQGAVRAAQQGGVRRREVWAGRWLG